MVRLLVGADSRSACRFSFCGRRRHNTSPFRLAPFRRRICSTAVWRGGFFRVAATRKCMFVYLEHLFGGTFPRIFARLRASRPQSIVHASRRQSQSVESLLPVRIHFLNSPAGLRHPILRAALKCRTRVPARHAPSPRAAAIRILRTKKEIEMLARSHKKLKSSEWHESQKAHVLSQARPHHRSPQIRMGC